jgi:murein DD-endopeptidase MepM/ murein hydrolase activator NlpD
MAWCAVAVWCTSVDWRTKRPFLTRITAHLSVIVLVFATIFLVSVEIREPRVSASGLFGADGAPFVTTSFPEVGLERLGLSTACPSGNRSRLSDAGAVSRLPTPHTVFPERPRARVINYIVQQGDTVFDIAAQFGLSPVTIVQSNRQVFSDVPWLIRAGTEILILPVDGAYHTVRSGETVAGIAADYDLVPVALYNEWNNLKRGKRPREGQRLVVPGGRGEELAWQLPPRYPVLGPDGYSCGICSGAVVTGPGGHGWFTYPTGNAQISGWYFRDPRRPTHIGIDYRCKHGDPIYAADNGIVTRASWHGTYGIMIEINHGNGFVTRYAHLCSTVAECGSPVYQGDLIGYCGNTGWSSGTHLHFEIRHHNVPQDPQIYLPPFGPN